MPINTHGIRRLWCHPSRRGDPRTLSATQNRYQAMTKTHLPNPQCDGEQIAPDSPRIAATRIPPVNLTENEAPSYYFKCEQHSHFSWAVHLRGMPDRLAGTIRVGQCPISHLSGTTALLPPWPGSLAGTNSLYAAVLFATKGIGPMTGSTTSACLHDREPMYCL